MHGPLDAVNDAFHAMYDAARQGAALEAAILVVLADALVVCQGDRVREIELLPRDFHAIKSAAHAPVAVYSALTDRVGGPVDDTTQRALSRLRDAARASSRALRRRRDAVARDMRDVLERSGSFLDLVLARGRASRAALDAFAGESARAIRRLTRQATREQLASLHAAVDQALRMLTAKERRTLQVVVAGDHQARARSLAMQYFQQRFGEPPGAEMRVAYGEGVTTVDEARALVGTRRLDRAVAAAFFGDAARLQQDILGDAAAAILREADLGSPRRRRR